MNTKTRSPFEVGIFAGLLLGIGTVVGASEYDRNIEKAFQVSPGGKLIVQADRGSMKVNSNGDEVHVRVLRRVKGGSQAQADELFTNHEVTLKQDGNTVSIIGRNKKDRFRFGSIRQPSLQVHYEIAIPKQFDVDLKTSGGDINLDHVAGSATLKTAGGNVFLTTAHGAVVARTAGGDIRADSIVGSNDAKTSAGNIEVLLIPSGAVKSKLSTSVGNVTLYIPENAKASITARNRMHYWGGWTSNEEVVYSDYKEDSYEQDERGREVRASYTLNGGGQSIILDASMGNIEILKPSSQHKDSHESKHKKRYHR